jgi:hypothetical protein
MMSNERTTELDNALLNQKNAIIELIDTADEAGLQEAQRQLDLVAEVWKVVHYDYKIRELQERIQARKQFLDGYDW